MKQMYEKQYEVPVEIPSHFVWEEALDYLPIFCREMQVIEGGCISLLILDKHNNFLLYYPFEEKQTFVKVDLPESEKPKVFMQRRSGRKLFAYTSSRLALIYKNKKVKFFNIENKMHSVSVTLPDEAVRIVSKAEKFYVRLKNKKIFIFSLDGDLLEKDSTDLHPFRVKKPIVEDDDVSIGAFGRDCHDNIWLIDEKNHMLKQYIKTVAYKEKVDVSYTFSSESDYTQWSKLYIDWEQPKGTAVEVEVNVDSKEVERFSTKSNMLLYAYEGRSLHVKLTLKSDESKRVTPKIYAIKTIINEKPYVEYLPAHYQKDEEKEVLSRYLSIFQEVMGDFEKKIEKSEIMLDPQKCDEEYLEWLSTLLGTTRDHRWEEQSWRNFLSELPELYKILGTKECMKRAIALYCDERPEIEEYFDGKPWTFCVHLSDKIIKNERDVEVIESIIEAFKPAHTNARLFIGYDEEAFMVGNSFLTLNTKIK